MKTNQTILQSQIFKLNITPQLKQSMHILQASSSVLSEFLLQQTVDNPLLEIEWNRTTCDKRKSYKADYGNAELYNLKASGETLESVLLSQLRVMNIQSNLYRLCCYLAGNLSEDGYLVISLEEASTKCRADQLEVEAAIKNLQALEPAGVGARNLQECLLLQTAKDLDADPIIHLVVSDYLQELAAGKLKRIADLLCIPLERVKQAAAYIRGLNPRPGLAYDSRATPYVQPDAIVRREYGGYAVMLNESHQPKLSINDHYIRLQSAHDCPEAQPYLQDWLQSAKGLLRGLQQRKQTMLMVLQAIVHEQQDFFDWGVGRLKPMNLSVIAEKLGIHESTVSRTVQNKYVLTPRGLFEMSYFFASKMLKEDGQETSVESIKIAIKRLIEHEDKSMPLSDQRITDLLVQGGVQISRRTVMKYREEMRTLSSRLRCSG